jgi:ABC-type metal ion transport system substrate-binding protein
MNFRTEALLSFRMILPMADVPFSLQKNGLLKLKDGIGLLPKVTDIVDNPKQLKILEIEAPQPRVLDDKKL